MEEVCLQAGEAKNVLFINPPTDCQFRYIQQAKSILNIFWIQVVVEAKKLNHIIEIQQVGEDAKLNMFGLVCLGCEAEVNFKSLVEHKTSKGNSFQLFKYVLKDRSRGGFDGRVIIVPNAQKTTVAQVNKNIVLTPLATMETRPQLEIYADDVKASHGATVGQLDEQALFYMQQRGIDQKTAYSLLLRAFVEDVVNRFPKSENDENIEALISHYLIDL